MATDNRIARRSFLTQALSAWFFVTCTPFLYGVLEYVLPPRIRERILEQILAAKIGDIPANAAKIVKFNKKPAIVVHTSQGQYKAFSAVCTHLGCTVQYNSDDQRIHCNCHGSVYDLTGKNIGGPAPSPLQPLRLIVRDPDIIISES